MEPPGVGDVCGIARRCKLDLGTWIASSSAADRVGGLASPTGGAPDFGGRVAKRLQGMVDHETRIGARSRKWSVAEAATGAACEGKCRSVGSEKRGAVRIRVRLDFGPVFHSIKTVL